MWDAVRRIDWSQTSLGPVESWPMALRTTLRMVLATRQPVCFWWGKNLIGFHNDAYAPMLGQRAETALGKPFQEVWHDVWDDVQPYVQSALAGVGTWEARLPLTMTRNGFPEETWWAFSYSPLFDETGQVAGIINITTDVTPSVLAERATAARAADLQKQAEQSALDRDRIWDNSVDLLGVADADGIWLNVNPAWTRALGWKASEIVGRTSEWMEHPDDRAKTRAEIAQLSLGNATFAFENRFMRRDGTYCVLSWKAVPADGLLYCVARDMTDALAQTAQNAELAEALGRANREIFHQHEADKVRRVLQHELSHRLKNAFAMVHAIVAQSARSGGPTDYVVKAITARVQALANAQELLVGTQHEGAEAADIIKSALKPHMDSEGAQVVFNGSPAFLSAQQGMGLALAVHELATNAAKYGGLSTPEGRVAIGWQADDTAFRFTWNESGGPAVTAPERQGFGSRLLTRIVPSYFTGTAELSYAPTGVRYVLNGTLTENQS